MANSRALIVNFSWRNGLSTGYPQQNPTRFLALLGLQVVLGTAEDAMAFGSLHIRKKNVQALQSVFLMSNVACLYWWWYMPMLSCSLEHCSACPSLLMLKNCNTQRLLWQICQKIYFYSEAEQTWRKVGEDVTVRESAKSLSDCLIDPITVKRWESGV